MLRNDNRGRGRGSGEGIGVVTSTVSGSFFALEACAKLRGGVAMAKQAEGADVVDVALAATFGDGKDVIGVPQAAAAGDGLHAVESESGSASRAASSPECGVCGNGVNVTGGAAAAVTGEDLVAKIARVGAQTPLMDAVVAAEGAATPGDDLKIAPAAERQAVGAGGEIVP
jgi:hypothetical protein